jgi:hypothetical protein
MTDTELIDLINSLSEEQISSIESIDAISSANTVIVKALGKNKVKLLEFKLTTSGDFSYRFIGTKLRDLATV